MSHLILSVHTPSVFRWSHLEQHLQEACLLYCKPGKRNYQYTKHVVPPFLLQKQNKSHLWVCGLFRENMVKTESFLPTVFRISNMDLKLRSKCQSLPSSTTTTTSRFTPVTSRFSRNVSFFGCRVAFLGRPIFRVPKNPRPRAMSVLEPSLVQHTN